MTRVGTLVLAVTVMLFGLLVGCPEKREVVAPKAGEKKLDLSADKTAIDASWILAVGKTPDVLVTLAGTSDGWRGLLSGDPAQALDDFVRSGDANVAVRIGGARAALELAQAHASLTALLIRSLPKLLDAQETRPDAKATASWRAFLRARRAQASGEDAKAALKALQADPSVGALAAAALGGDTPQAKLFAGEIGGLDAAIPAGGTSALGARLEVIALAKAGRLKEAQARWKRISPKTPDYAVGQGDQAVSFLDPVAANAGTILYASIALVRLEGLDGAPALLRAAALDLLDRPADALSALKTLESAPPDTIEFAQLVASSHLGLADALAAARAEQVRLLVKTGDRTAAQNLFGKLGSDTVGQRVNRAWAGASLGETPKGAFPDDRDVVLKLVSHQLTALGKDAAGVTDVTELALSERWVDAVQRRYADALYQADVPELAVKNRDAAEDKRAAFAPSARNTLSALTASALNNVRIGRFRVALKYLSRLESRLPAAAGPSEILRDLLSHKALQESGGATAGQ